jgi:hypothetical protein
MSRENHFGDVEKQLAHDRGVFAGSEGWSNQERIEESVNPDGKGYDFVCNCQNCGKKVIVTLPWIELITASVRLTPVDADTGQPWTYQNGFLYPPIQCGCGRPIHVPITPDKAQRYLQTGVSMNILTPQVVQAKQQEVLAISQRGRR